MLKKKITFADQFPEQIQPEMPYKKELQLKKAALAAHWSAHHLPGDVPDIVPSPLPRHYRATSKRKAIWLKGRLEFSMGYELRQDAGSTTAGALLEGELHERIYAKTLAILRKPHYAPLAKALNFCIIRGSGNKGAAVILNLFRLSGEIVRKLKMYTAEIAGPDVGAVFLYHDETRSEYYFESFRPRGNVNFKKLSGSSMLALTLPDQPKLLYPPTVFSQVNESILPAFTAKAFELLGLDGKPGKHLIDLYCGYGLFALLGAPLADRVTGIDFEGPAIRAAKANAEHLYPEKEIRFEAASITPDALERLLPPPQKGEVILLDPPRNGTADGVISAITARKPERILAIYCGIDRMPEECRIWAANGYQPEKTVCFDMFPGSPNLETMILLKRAVRKPKTGRG